MSQWACATLGGATRSKASKTQSTSEGEVERACIKYHSCAPIELDAAMSSSLHPGSAPTAAAAQVRGCRHEYAAHAPAGRPAVRVPVAAAKTRRPGRIEGTRRAADVRGQTRGKPGTERRRDRARRQSERQSR